MVCSLFIFVSALLFADSTSLSVAAQPDVSVRRSDAAWHPCVESPSCALPHGPHSFTAWPSGSAPIASVSAPTYIASGSTGDAPAASLGAPSSTASGSATGAGTPTPALASASASIATPPRARHPPRRRPRVPFIPPPQRGWRPFVPILCRRDTDRHVPYYVPYDFYADRRQLRLLRALSTNSGILQIPTNSGILQIPNLAVFFVQPLAGVAPTLPALAGVAPTLPALAGVAPPLPALAGVAPPLPALAGVAGKKRARGSRGT
jgi:hypothetical protein